MRLNKYIAMSGYCSRRQADEYIEKGKVKLNGKVASLGNAVDETVDRVEVCGKKISLADEKVYIMLNKPRGYATTNSDENGRKIIYDIVKSKHRLFAVGRLDIATEGLILLTNDGEFANNLMHPSKKVEKVYVAKVKGDITDEKIEKLISGVEIDGYMTKEAKVRKISGDELEITIMEGKNRQVRKMCEAVQLDVSKLRRIKLGELELKDLRIGEYRDLTNAELELLNITKEYSLKKETNRKNTNKKY